MVQFLKKKGKVSKHQMDSAFYRSPIFVLKRDAHGTLDGYVLKLT
jgi:hypothetical protein